MDKMRFLFKLICYIGVLLPATAHAENCPWLNAATAGGVLGGDVTMSVSHADAKSTACEFVRQSGSAISSLQISVSTLSGPFAEYLSHTAKCETNAIKLIGVGNEASACVVQGTKGTIAEQVVGRVRDRAFVIRWTLSADAARTSQTTAETLQALTEAVAGSMF